VCAAIDQAQVATEQIDKLRELIDPRVTEELPDLRDRLNPSQFGRFTLVRRGAEFERCKPAAAAPKPLLSLENRTGTLELDREGDAYHQWERYK